VVLVEAATLQRQRANPRVRTGARAQVVLELVELREVDTARAMLRQTAVFAGMKQEEPDRFLRLEHLCGRAYFDVRRGAGLRGRCAQAVRLV